MRLTLWLLDKWLRFKIRETEAYLRDCARDGLTDSLSIRDWRAQLAGLHAERLQIAVDREALREGDPDRRESPFDASVGIVVGTIGGSLLWAVAIVATLAGVAMFGGGQ